jgi:hypothetical protein
MAQTQGRLCPQRVAPSSERSTGRPTGRTVRIRRTGWFRRTRKATSDANGWFGMTKLSPGKYVIQLEDAAGNVLRDRVEAVVSAGTVARVALASR